MIYEIIIGEAIGNIKIGMKRDEVKQLLADLDEYKEIPFGYTDEVVYDCNEDFQIMYDKNDCVNFILCTSPEKLSLADKMLNTDISYDDILSIAKHSATDVDEDGVGFVSNRLGFGVCFDTEDDEQVRIESVQIAAKDFWKDE